MSKKLKMSYVIYIPEEGHWDIRGEHASEKEARLAYLKQTKRKRLPAGSFIHQK